MKKNLTVLTVVALGVVAQVKAAHAPCELEIRNNTKPDIFVIDTNGRGVWIRGQRDQHETKHMFFNPEIAGAKGMTDKPELKIYVENPRNERKNLQHYYLKYNVLQKECAS
ncbi:MAG TPA: hypothetical protein VLH77_04160, partial [Gammaproteobacteria bacterium]|nr:hypothetical protein [Gammaproteobacteria bacterium]